MPRDGALEGSPSFAPSAREEAGAPHAAGLQRELREVKIDVELLVALQGEEEQRWARWHQRYATRCGPEACEPADALPYDAFRMQLAEAGTTHAKLLKGPAFARVCSLSWSMSSV